MKKVKVYAITTMDGFVARANGDIDWAIGYAGKGSYGYTEVLKTIDCVLINHNYYAQLASYDLKWPFGDLPCYVLTKESFVYPSGIDIQLAFYNDHTDYPDKIEELLRLGYENIWVAGNQELIAMLIARNIVDEITLLIIPVILGHGTALLGGVSQENTWQLENVDRYDSGVVKIKYSRKETQ